MIDEAGQVLLRDRLDALFGRGDAAAIRDAPSFYRQLRESAPALEYGELVLFSRYDDVRSIILDASRYSNKKGEGSNRGLAYRQNLSGPHADAYDYVYSIEGRWLTRIDGDDHARMRSIAQRFFSPRRIAELRESAQQYTDAMLDEMRESASSDWSEFAYRMPLMVVCDLLGAPLSDLEVIRDWSATITENFAAYDHGKLLAAARAYAEFEEYVGQLISQQRQSATANGEHGLVSALIDAQDSALLNVRDVTGMFIVILLAGHETTSTLIATGLYELLQVPEQWRILCDAPESTSGAIDELLRIVSPVQWDNRQVLVETTVRGVDLHPGQDVIVSLAGANRDPRVFEDPETLNVMRAEAGKHLAFAVGPHFCLGSALARLEGEVVFATLARRFPEVVLASEEIDWQGGGMANVILRSVGSLPITLGQERRLISPSLLG